MFAYRTRLGFNIIRKNKDKGNDPGWKATNNRIAGQ